MPSPDLKSCSVSALSCRAPRARFLSDSHLLGVVAGAPPAAAHSAVVGLRHDDGRGFDAGARPRVLNIPACDADGAPVGGESACIDRWPGRVPPLALIARMSSVRVRRGRVRATDMETRRRVACLGRCGRDPDGFPGASIEGGSWALRDNFQALWQAGGGASL